VGEIDNVTFALPLILKSNNENSILTVNIWWSYRKNKLAPFFTSVPVS